MFDPHSIINNIVLIFRCEADFVELRDGRSVESNLIAKLCGQTHTSIYESTSNFMFIRMKTNDEITGKGFKFHYNTGEFSVVLYIVNTCYIFWYVRFSSFHPSPQLFCFLRT